MSLDLESRIAAANPIVGDDALDGLFGDDAAARLLRDVRAKQEGRMSDVTRLPHQADQKSSETTRKFERESTKRGPSRQVLLGAAAALAVVAGAAIVVWLATATGENVATPETPLEIAEAFIEARDEYDIDTTLALLAPDAVISDVTDNVEGYRGHFERFEIVGQRTYLEECTVQSEGPPSRVECTYTHEGDWSRALGAGPYDGSYFVFTIESGRITRVTNFFDTTAFSPEVWEVFAAWVADNHPDDVLRLYQDSSQSGLLTTPEALDLLRQFTEEFVAEQRG